MNFIKRYAASLAALVVALVVLFWFLNFVGTRAPGVVGTTAEKVGGLASGQKYNFS